MAAATGNGQPVWTSFFFVIVPSLLILTWFGVPLVQGVRRRRATQETHQLFATGRYLETLTQIKRARRLWPSWEGLTFLQGKTELVLWRVDAARATLHRLMSLGLGFEPQDERIVFTTALIAAEVAGDAENVRERVAAARYHEAYLVLPNLIRAARERDHALVLELASQEDLIPREFMPLVRVLAAWSREEAAPQAIDPIPLLGETGLDQVEKVWPDLADFIRRAPRPS
ncbi:MAG TPA: hypothetical protein VGD87_07125 [Archangium sp.]